MVQIVAEVQRARIVRRFVEAKQTRRLSHTLFCALRLSFAIADVKVAVSARASDEVTQSRAFQFEVGAVPDFLWLLEVLPVFREDEQRHVTSLSWRAPFSRVPASLALTSF